jgi:esterase/lipase superfamily enzyme
VQNAGAERILLVGHSMGAMLVMETMRQISLQNRLRLNLREIGLALISPDISVDVFNTQVERLNPMPRPFNIFTSQTDRPLKLSGALAAQSARLGRLVDLERLSQIEVTLIEVSEFDIGGSGHFIVGSSSALIKVMSFLNKIDRLFLSSVSVRAGLFPGDITTAGKATRIVLRNVENSQ